MLDKLEVAGNKLPDPVTLFLIFCVILVIVSDLVAGAGVSVVHPSTKKTVVAVSLLTKEGLQRILSQVVNNFQGFPPLGLVLVVVIGLVVLGALGIEALLRLRRPGARPDARAGAEAGAR